MVIQENQSYQAAQNAKNSCSLTENIPSSSPYLYFYFFAHHLFIIFVLLLKKIFQVSIRVGKINSVMSSIRASALQAPETITGAHMILKFDAVPD